MRIAPQAGGGVLVGVLGLGRGAAIARSARADPRVDEVIVVDVAPAAPVPAGCTRVTDLPALLGRRPHVVVVATPAPLHHEQNLAVINGGVGVLVSETPPFSTTGQGRSLARAAGRRGTVVLLAEDYLWMDWVATTAADIAAGELGQLLSGHGYCFEDARSAFYDASGAPTWRADLSPFHYLTHLLGPMLHLLDDRVVSAGGFAAKAAGTPGADRPDSAHAVMRTEGGRYIEISTGFGAAHPFGFHLALVGSHGVRRLEHFGSARALAGPDPLTSDWTGGLDHSFDESGAQARTQHLVRHVVDVTLGESAPLPGLDLLLRSTLPGIIAARSAAAGGRHLPVPDHRRWL